MRVLLEGVRVGRESVLRLYLRNIVSRCRPEYMHPKRKIRARKEFSLSYDRVHEWVRWMRCKDCWHQQPLPSRLQVAPSQMGRECSPASSGVSVTVPSSSTKQGIPAAPYRLASSNTGLLSRSFKNALRFPKKEFLSSRVRSLSGWHSSRLSASCLALRAETY